MGHGLSARDPGLALALRASPHEYDFSNSSMLQTYAQGKSVKRVGREARSILYNMQGSENESFAAITLVFE